MLCAKFHAKQTILNYFNVVSAKKCLKKPYNRNFALIFKHITIILKSNDLKNYNTCYLVLCSNFHAKQTMFELF